MIVMTVVLILLGVLTLVGWFYLALLLDRRDAAFRELLENSRQALNEKRGQS